MSVDGHVRRWPWLVVAAVVCFLLLSIEPFYQLKQTPPPKFSGVQLPAGMDRQRWSQLYWERSRFVQWHYRKGYKLPEQPPDDFHIAEEQTLPAMTAEQIRYAYWAQLRSMWVTSEPWKTSYSLDFHWVARAIVRVLDSILDGLRIFRSSIK